MTSYSNTSGGSYQNYSFNNKPGKSSSSDDDHGFHTLVAPWDLDGIEGIWKIVIEVVNRTVYEKASQMLIRLYTSPTFLLEDRISEFEDAFIKRCLDQIRELKEEVLNREEEPNEEYERVEKPISKFSTITSTVTQKI
jgi:hypothetical protein